MTAYGDTTQGGATNGYSTVVPIEDPDASTGDFAVSGNSRVMCLSCHRAHATASKAPTGVVGYATGTKNMTRWDNTAASGGKKNCNKCHQKGE